MKKSLLLVSVLALGLLQAPGSTAIRKEPVKKMPEVTQSLDRVKVFAIYEPVYSPEDVQLLRRARPDVVCRGWFKWGSSRDWQAFAPLAQACRKLGILVQGGITCAAIYPEENGIDAAAFQDYATTDLDGKPYHVGGPGGWYHVSLYNPKVIAYMKEDVRRQIDAGAAGIWYDEIEGYYDWNPTEGYDPYACAAFRDWLIRKYCVGQGWKEDDSRWHTVFGIDLARFGGSIRNFDYREHLRITPGKDGKPLAADPPQGNPRAWESSPNPLYREWGYAWDRRAKGTFRYDTVAAIFADLVADANRYARGKYGRPLINTYNHNGTARPGVEFLQPHNGAQPPLVNGRLNGTVSYLDYYERTVRDAAEACPGVPVVFFVDWPGETDRLAAMSRADQVHFFATYIPEAYAAGGEFALPLRGYVYIAAAQGTIGYLSKLADFYREQFPWLRGSRPESVSVEAPEGVSVRVRRCALGTAIHLINHNFSLKEVWPQPLHSVKVSLHWQGGMPAGAFAVSPDFLEQQPVTMQRQRDRLTLTIPTLECSAMVLLPRMGAMQRIAGKAADGMHIMAVGSRAMAVADDGAFTLWAPHSVRMVECLETGQQRAAGESLRFSTPVGKYAAGVLLDTYGVPQRGIELRAGSRRLTTDPWGRFRIPLSVGDTVQVPGADGDPVSLQLREGFTAWQITAAQRPIASFEQDLDSCWANWPNKGKAPEAIQLLRETHAGKTTLRCSFLPVGASWCNVNSGSVSLRDMDFIEIIYAGDGTRRSVNAVLQAFGKGGDTFFHYSLPLNSQGWSTKRIALTDFRSEEGKPFDPAAFPQVVFQLAPGAKENKPATIWLHSARLLRAGSPVQERWRADEEKFDQVDPEQLRVGHQPLYQPLPATARRLPLLSFEKLPEGFFVNWQDLESRPALVRAQCETDARGEQYLRAIFPAGESGWANCNQRLPLERLRQHAGLIVRLRAEPANQPVRLALHVTPGERQGSTAHEFYEVDVLPSGEGWSEIALPWDAFKNGARAFSFEGITGVSLQINRPGGVLEHDQRVDLLSLELFDR